MGNGVLDLPQVFSRVFLADSGEQVDFFIRGYSNTKFSFFGWDVYLTTTHISMIIVIAAILVLQYVQTVPLRMQILTKYQVRS